MSVSVITMPMEWRPGTPERIFYIIHSFTHYHMIMYTVSVLYVWHPHFPLKE